MAEVFLSPNGNDASSGSISQPWQTLAKLTAMINAPANGITAAYLMEAKFGSGNYFDLPTQISTGANTSDGFALIGDGPTEIRAWATLVKANMSQPDAGNYPNVWAIAHTGASLVMYEWRGYDAATRQWGDRLLPYLHPTGSSFAAVAATLNSTPGSFWTDGTTMYFRPLIGNDPVNDAVVYTASRPYDGDGTGSPIAFNHANMRIENVCIGGCGRARSTDNEEDQGYCMYLNPSESATVRNCYLYHGSKHNLGFMEPANGSEILADGTRIEQAAGWNDLNPATSIVIYSTNDASGLKVTIKNCTTKAARGKPLTTEGQPGGAFITHGREVLATLTFDYVNIDHCDFGDNTISGLGATTAFPAVDLSDPDNPVGGMHITNSRFYAGLITNLTCQKCQLIGGIPDTNADDAKFGAVDCLVAPTRGGRASAETGIAVGTLQFEHCTFDLTGLRGYGYHALYVSSGGKPYTLKMHNSIVKQAIGGDRVSVVVDVEGVATLDMDNNLYTPAAFRLTGGGTVATLAQWRTATGQDLDSIVVDDVTLDANGQPTDPAYAAYGLRIDIGAAAQRAADVAEYTAEKANIPTTVTVFGVQGERDVEAELAAAVAEQITVSQGAVLGQVANIRVGTDFPDLELTNIGTLAVATQSTGTMTLSAGRAWVRQFARNAGDSSVYTDADIDRAIMAAANTFIDATRSTMRLDTVTAAAGSDEVDLSSVGGFRPDRIKRIYLGDRPLGIWSWEELVAQQDCTGTPTAIAFEDWQTARVYPTPTANTDIKVRWYPPFSSWDVGCNDTTAQGIIFNLPDDWMQQILIYGATSILQHTDPQQLYANASYQKFQAFIKSMTGAGNIGAKVSYRTE